MRSMTGRIDSGGSVAAYFNARAKQVTPKVVSLFKERLPDARVFACSTFEEARLAAQELVSHPPRVLLVGGGDGSIITLLNFLRDAGAASFPTLGLFKLGTGNGWPRETGAQGYKDTLRWLPRCPLPTPVRHFELADVGGHLCHFAGTGWDATVLDHYRLSLERRAQALVASKLAAAAHKGALGYVYAILRHTVPEETLRAREGRVRLTIRNLGAHAHIIDKEGRPHPLKRKDGIVWRGPMGFAGIATEPQWGAAVRAFPFATLVPGTISVRAFDRHVLHAVRHGVEFWTGQHFPGMHDFLCTHVRFELSQPMAWQLGGDPMGKRDTLEMKLAPFGVDLVDWPRAHLAAGPLD